MLVVVKNGNFQFFFQGLFNFETLGRFYVFEINSAKCGRNGFYHFDEFFRIFFIHFNVEDIYIGKNFEKQSFTFHHRFAGFGANIAKS